MWIHDCGREDCDGVERYRIDPYNQEIWGEETWLWLCDGAYANSSDEI